ncbi:DsbA family protein [Nocardioides daeguensis]|uniref:Thioredoxin domain-containing protein n=1 Tax=Nocardioides daeguensis TaxID=908359 RepID=A0ABP6USI2_9ACTN|nr:thioredoxin domain-containing protein [Nocardioides daeguensis]MBV6729217.1 DsbA family protein [Nocardioides daeguensis]MCR1774784.1 DsbA family protein [Nocardioides daeguensis]
MSSNSKASARAQKAAEMRAAQNKREARRRILTIAGVLGVMVLIVGGSIGVSLLNKEDVKAAGAGSSEYGVTIGESDAPHSVVIYEDFLCPYCGQLERATRKDLARLAADGKVFVEYRPFDLLSSIADYPIRATNAFAVVLEKSGPDVAKKFHDLLYENQPSEQDPGSMTDDDLVKLAVEAGATEGDVRADIEGLAQQAWVDKATQEAADSGVKSTPTILLDGKVFQDGRTIQDMADNLMAELE